MKKAQLYRSIDNIKPDRSMKNRIMNAVKANDRITIYKKPVFIPVAAGILLAVNLGFACGFILKDEFQCRLSINDRHGIEIKSNWEFESYADKVYDEITRHDYISVSFERDESYAPGTEHPWYCVYGTDALRNGTDNENSYGNYVYIRYIQIQGGNYTNHEYIIGYDGEGTGRENMVSITESDVDYNYNDNINFSDSKGDITQENISESDIYSKAYIKAEEFSNESGYTSFQVDENSDVCIYAFPYNNDTEDTRRDKLFYRYYMSFYTDNYSADEDYMISTSEDGYVSISEDGYVLSFGEGRDCEKYWKETLSNDGRDYRVEVLPDIENKDRDGAVKQLKSLGFTNISARYISQPGGVPGDVMGYGYDMGAGDPVKIGDEIEILICMDTAMESDAAE